MSKVQEDRDKMKNIYYKTLKYLSLVNFPIYIIMAILAAPLVNILFGSQWQGAIILFKFCQFMHL